MNDLTDSQFQAIARLMHDEVGLSLSESKRTLVVSRLSARIQKLGMSDFGDYLELIGHEDPGPEFQVAVDLLTTNETYFFREPAHFELLERELGSARKREPPAVWSAACSFGDECFTLAMVLAELEASGRIARDWSILGTDISDRVLKSARQGIFPEERLRAVSAVRRKRYCLKGEGPAEGLAKVHPNLARRVTFGRINLCRPIENLGPFDAIFLRNVLIYFDAPTKLAVVDRVIRHLVPGGLFFVGTAEGRVQSSAPLTRVAPGVFRKEAA